MSVPSSSFAGFSAEAVQFLADLAEHNDRAWFQPRKADYQRLLKEPLERLCDSLGERLRARGIPLRADARRSPFRIYRDTRFSRDKSPYKTHLGAIFPWLGDGVGEAPIDGPHGNGGYFNFQPGEMYVGGGMWMAPKPKIDAFRRAIVERPDEVRAALEEPGFVNVFGGVRSHESLKRVPAGYPVDHPLADLLRWKDVVFGRRLADEEVFSPDLPDRLAGDYASAVPVFRFLAGLEP